MSDISVTPPAANRERIAKIVTYFVLSLTGVILIGGLIIIICEKEPDKGNKFDQFKDVISVLLPLWGTWIGTVLAYYFSKENFESANKSVQQIVDKMTSEKKLESVKAADVMIAKKKLIFQTLSAGEELSKFKLKEDCIDFVARNKIKRVVILDESECAKYVIHRDAISFFIANEILKGNSVIDFTLKDMYTKGTEEIKSIFNNSVKFIDENSNLLAAQKIMQQYSSCQDVFITKSAAATDPVLGWITNVTISENSIV